MLGTGILDFVVADAVLARDENHRRRGDTRDIDRIVARAADHFPVRKPERARCRAHRVDATRVEARRREVVDLLQIAFEAKVGGDCRRGVAKLAVHRREILVIGMPHVDGHLDEPGDDVARIGADLHESYRGSAVGRMA